MGKIKTGLGDGIDKQLNGVVDQIDDIDRGVRNKQDEIKVVDTQPDGNTLNNKEIQVFSDDKDNAKIFFKDNDGNVFSLALQKE